MYIKNAVIESVTLTTADHGLLSAWLYLNYGNSSQGFGGYALYLPKDFSHHQASSGIAGHFIFRCLEIGGVTEWSKLKGQTIRVRLTSAGLDGRIEAIGHIIEDKWFVPSKEFPQS
jgi:hypothetical protein